MITLSNARTGSVVNNNGAPIGDAVAMDHNQRRWEAGLARHDVSAAAALKRFYAPDENSARRLVKAALAVKIPVRYGNDWVAVPAKNANSLARVAKQEGIELREDAGASMSHTVKASGYVMVSGIKPGSPEARKFKLEISRNGGYAGATTPIGNIVVSLTHGINKTTISVDKVKEIVKKYGGSIKSVVDRGGASMSLRAARLSWSNVFRFQNVAQAKKFIERLPGAMRSMAVHDGNGTVKMNVPNDAMLRIARAHAEAVYPGAIGASQTVRFPSRAAREHFACSLEDRGMPVRRIGTLMAAVPITKREKPGIRMSSMDLVMPSRRHACWLASQLIAAGYKVTCENSKVKCSYPARHGAAVMSLAARAHGDMSVSAARPKFAEPLAKVGDKVTVGPRDSSNEPVSGDGVVIKLEGMHAVVKLANGREVRVPNLKSSIKVRA